MDTYKQVNTASLLAALVLTVVAIYVGYSSCHLSVCQKEFEFGVLKPMKYASIWLAGIFAFFLFFNSQYFKEWLSKIFVWFILVSFFLIHVAFPTSDYAQDWVNRSVAINFLGFYFSIISVYFLTLVKYKKTIDRLVVERNATLYFDEVQKSAKWLMVIVFSFFIHIFTPIYCGGLYYCSHNRDTITSTIFGLLLCIPIVSYLLSFNIVVFLRWIRHIAWWYAIFVPLSIGGESGNFLVSGEMVVAFLLVVLFVITLLYTPIINRYLRKNLGLPGPGTIQFRLAASSFFLSMILLLVVFLYS